jgi:hypothetical protein
MALVFMPRKTAIVFLFIAGAFCLVDGIHKKDTKEMLVGVVILICAVVKLITGREKKLLNNNKDHDKTNTTGR